LVEDAAVVAWVPVALALAALVVAGAALAVVDAVVGAAAVAVAAGAADSEGDSRQELRGSNRRICHVIISVASGKGGTGKTLVATSLALSLDEGAVQLLDCDVEEPDAHILLRPQFGSHRPVVVPVPRVDEARCTYCRRCSAACVYNAIAVMGKTVLLFPELCHGCGACTYLCPEDAITEESREVGVVEVGRAAGVRFVHGRLAIGEAMPAPVIRAVKARADHAATVIIDAPPGTACPVVEAVRGSDFCLLVTEPTPFGLYDLTLAVALTRDLAVPCGVVINRHGLGDDAVDRYCAEQGLPVLLRIPFDRRIAELYCRGVTLAEGMPEWKRPFRELFEGVRGLVPAGV
jgi:MinD superfamily P-loop ATPase